MKIKGILAASLLGLMMSAPANASTIDYIFSGVLISCPDTGFLPCGDTVNSGDSVSGLISFDAAAVVPGGTLGSGDYAGYSFDFGGPLVFDDSASSVVSSFLALDDDLAITGGSVRFTIPMLFASGEITDVVLTFGADQWFAEVMDGTHPVTIASGVGKIAIVPVPGALLMFAPALLGFLGLRRRNAA